jgi:hypothetical protein
VGRTATFLTAAQELLSGLDGNTFLLRRMRGDEIHDRR